MNNRRKKIPGASSKNPSGKIKNPSASIKSATAGIRKFKGGTHAQDVDGLYVCQECGRTTKSQKIAYVQEQLNASRELAHGIFGLR